VPDIKNYLYEVGLGINADVTGRLWLMPAGRQDISYDTRFRAIDWQDFYKNEGGFLFFEDVRVQWEELLQIDYVLIDSRTGHTDIGGICTRQLPDSVVTMFFPNEQNLRGLNPIVKDIRNEKNTLLNRHTSLYFVMANLPDLDDEDQILSDAMTRSQEELGYKSLSATIHHFNSLAMLEQRIFVLERPKSKLASEYKRLVSVIVRGNVEDKEGVIAYLDETLTKLRLEQDSVSLTTLEERLRLVKEEHPSDIDILGRLARLRRVQRRTDEALELLDQVVKLGGGNAEILLARAEMYAQLGRKNLALEDLSTIFQLPYVSPFNLSVAVRLKLDLDPDGLASLEDSAAMQNLRSEGICAIAHELERNVDTIKVAESLLRRWLELHPSSPGLFGAKLEYVLCLIGTGKFVVAMDAVSPDPPVAEELDIFDAFNYAMSEWGATGNLRKDLLQHVINLSLENGFGGPNYYQCLSIAYWAVGNREQAFLYYQKSFDSISGAKDATFSAWSYLFLPAESFLDDLFEMKSLLDGLPLIPRFLRRAESTT
jgi:tetratricopeptide (TPR) repeat protein